MRARSTMKVSVQVANTKTLSVHWLGTTLRFAAMTCTASGKPDNQRYSYTVSVTDLVSTKTVALLRETEALEPLVALRTCPGGRYLAIMPRAGGLQVRSAARTNASAGFCCGHADHRCSPGTHACGQCHRSPCMPVAQCHRSPPTLIRG